MIGLINSFTILIKLVPRNSLNVLPNVSSCPRSLVLIRLVQYGLQSEGFKEMPDNNAGCNSDQYPESKIGKKLLHKTIARKINELWLSDKRRE